MCWSPIMALPLTRPAHEIKERLLAAKLPIMSIEELSERAYSLTGTPAEIEYTDRIVGVIRYRDGSIIDVVKQVK